MAACSAAIWENELSEGRRAEWGEQRGRDVIKEDLLGIFRTVDEGGEAERVLVGYANLKIAPLDFRMPLPKSVLSTWPNGPEVTALAVAELNRKP